MHDEAFDALAVDYIVGDPIATYLVTFWRLMYGCAPWEATDGLAVPA